VSQNFVSPCEVIRKLVQPFWHTFCHRDNAVVLCILLLFTGYNEKVF